MDQKKLLSKQCEAMRQSREAVDGIKAAFNALGREFQKVGNQIKSVMSSGFQHSNKKPRAVLQLPEAVIAITDAVTGKLRAVGWEVHRFDVESAIRVELFARIPRLPDQPLYNIQFEDERAVVMEYRPAGGKTYLSGGKWVGPHGDVVGCDEVDLGPGPYDAEEAPPPQSFQYADPEFLDDLVGYVGPAPSD